MDMQVILGAFTLFIALAISIGFHEAAHAYTAKWLGDNTAEKLGRTTLNPLPHLAPMGIFIPVLLALMQIPILFGWGKPVPVQLDKLRYGRVGHLLVSIAGPVTNLILCFICVLMMAIYEQSFKEAIPEPHLLYPIVKLVGLMIYLNAILAVFNLIPLPPLDGGAILPLILPKGIRDFFDDYIAPYGFFLFLALAMSGKMNWIWQAASGYIKIVQDLVKSIL